MFCTHGIIFYLYGLFSLNELDLVNSELEQDYFRNTSDQLKKIENFCRNISENEAPLFQKMIFIVIDALRMDSVSSFDDRTSMPFVTGLINDVKAMQFISEARAPTVTMSRIKAMMSGTLPAFVDVMLNFNAIRFKGDSFIEQSWKHEKKIIFVGDNTWLQLFPDS
ncbi:GPI ethanolamine phosphate transferase 2-like isoform X2, partial [Dinothrombium tinctorium]